MSSRKKIHSLEEMKGIRAPLGDASQRLVLPNACFDLLHPGHLRYLAQARALGDRLVVAVNADETVRRLKGEGRPLVPLDERMEVLAALEVVDYVISFAEETPAKVVRELLPDVLVKGGDWAPEQIVGKDTVEKAGGRVISLPYATGYSTSQLIDRIVSRLGEQRR